MSDALATIERMKHRKEDIERTTRNGRLIKVALAGLAIRREGFSEPGMRVEPRYYLELPGDDGNRYENEIDREALAELARLITIELPQ